MSLERGVLTPTTDKDGKPTTEIRNFTTSFNLPLLTIIPVNSLGVNNVDISFDGGGVQFFGNGIYRCEYHHRSLYTGYPAD